jgi:hypothetical protein
MINTDHKAPHYVFFSTPLLPRPSQVQYFPQYPILRPLSLWCPQCETKLHTHTKQQTKVQSCLLLGITSGSDGFKNNVVQAIDWNSSGPAHLQRRTKIPYSVSNTEQFRMPSKKFAASKQLLGNRWADISLFPRSRKGPCNWVVLGLWLSC